MTNLFKRAGLLLLSGLLLSSGLAQQETLEFPIDSSAGDAEEFLEGSLSDAERWPAGYSYLVSSDLELGFDADHGPQLVGLHFSGLEFPDGLPERLAVRFTAVQSDSEPVAVTIRAQTGEVAPFANVADGEAGFDLSGRPASDAQASWSIEPWEAGGQYETPDLLPLLSEVAPADGPFDLVLIFTPQNPQEGAVRNAYSFDGSSTNAPVLVASWGAAADGSPEESQAGADEAAGEGEAPPVAAEPEPAPEEPAAQPEPAPEEHAQPEPAPPVVQPVDPVPAEPAQEAPQGVPAQPVTEPEEPATRRTWLTAPAERVADRDAAAEERTEGSPIRELETRPGAALDGREPQRMSFPIEPVGRTGVTGSVMLTEMTGDRTVLSVLLDNPDPAASYRSSIYEGSCGTVSSRTRSLERIAEGNVLGTRVIHERFEDLAGQEFHLNVFSRSDDTELVGCADFSAPRP